MLFLSLSTQAQISCESILKTKTNFFSKELKDAGIAYMMHTTHISNFLSILKTKSILTRESLKSQGIAIADSMGGMGNVVYMQLVPQKTIGTRTQAGVDLNFYLTGSLNDPNAPPNNVILVFSNAKADEALYITSSWNFGMYSEMESVKPNEPNKMKNVLSRIKLGVGNEILFPDTNLKHLKKILVHPSVQRELLDRIKEIDPLRASDWEKLIMPVHDFPQI